MATVTMRNLLEAGVHFGHQTRRWNPKMRPYIFTERNGIYIIDLQRTLREIQAAYEFARDVTARGGEVLFVGTKKQAQEPVEREAARAGMPFVNQRWLGGMLTNWTTMRTRITRLEELEGMREDGSYDALPKKEVLKLEAEREKLDRNLSGIRNMEDIPEALFVIDTRREIIPISEARKLNIQIIGLVDTNSDPDEVTFVIPGNDDAIRSVGLMCRIIADACIEGRLAAGLPVPGDAPPLVPTPVDDAADDAMSSVEESGPTTEAAALEDAADDSDHDTGESVDIAPPSLDDDAEPDALDDEDEPDALDDEIDEDDE